MANLNIFAQLAYIGRRAHCIDGFRCVSTLYRDSNGELRLEVTSDDPDFFDVAFQVSETEGRQWLEAGVSG